MTDKNINYEVLPAGMAMDETDVNLPRRLQPHVG